jgi:hypothetical protein
MRFLWQWPTAVLGIDLVGPLNIRIDSSRLAAEYAAVSARFRPSLQHGPHHDGGWNRLGLIAPGGDPYRSLARPGEVKAPTAVLALMPTVAELIEALGQEVAAASLSIMAPGATVRWHRDPEQCADATYARLHLPIATSAGSTKDLGHRRWHLAAGHVWYGDFSFPHRVFNDCPNERVHVMVDVRLSEHVRGLLPPFVRRQERRRRLARRLACQIFDMSERLHAEGRYAAAFRRQRQLALRSGTVFEPEAVGTLRARQQANQR